MKDESLEKVLLTLCELKTTLHSDANVSAIEQLDQAIELVHSCIERKEELSNDQVLSLLGNVLSALPSISRLIEVFLE